MAMVLRAEITVSSREQHFLHAQRVSPAAAREGITSTVSFELGVWAEKHCRRRSSFMRCFFEKSWVIVML
jgi:hypothetical protein